jgi:hypothetical protein
MKHWIVGCAAILVSLVACNTSEGTGVVALAVVKEALNRLDKAPHYRIDAITTIGGEVREYILDYIAPDRTHYRSPQAEAIRIGTTYYDRFMGGTWNVSSVGSSTLPSKPEAFDPSEITKVLPLGKGKLKAKPCDIYMVSLRGSTTGVDVCVESATGLPLIIDIDEDAEGDLVQEFDYDVPITITAPV